HKSQLTGRFDGLLIETVAESARHLNVRHAAIRFQQHGDFDRTFNLIAPRLVGVTRSRASEYLRPHCDVSYRKHAVVIYTLSCTDPGPVASADPCAMACSRSAPGADPARHASRCARRFCRLRRSGRLRLRGGLGL